MTAQQLIAQAIRRRAAARDGRGRHQAQRSLYLSLLSAGDGHAIALGTAAAALEVGRAIAARAATWRPR